jgi:hypothetical protein
LEGPYRDLGSGLVRLSGVEGVRRSPGRLRSVEDALFELLRNSRDAGARNIYVASSLRARRYRTLVVIDDGHGIPDTHKHIVFEPGVTSRHLVPIPEDADQDGVLHGAGLSLYHLRNAALSAEFLSASSPTAIKAVFDTRTLPEKSLQSGARPSKTNLPATLARFVAGKNPAHREARLYYASPARILALLLQHRIIQYSDGGYEGKEGEKESGGRGGGEAGRVWKAALGLGLEVSLRTVQRVISGEIPPAGEVTASPEPSADGSRTRVVRRDGLVGPILPVEAEDLAEILGVLRRVARSSYLELAGLDVERRPGEVILRARVYEPEEEYE